MKTLTFDAPSNFTVTTSSQQVLAADSKRVFCEIINTHASAKIFLAFGAHDAVANKGTCLMPNGGTLTLTEEYMKCRQRVSAICDTGTANAAIQIGR